MNLVEVDVGKGLARRDVLVLLGVLLEVGDALTHGVDPR